MDPNRLKLEILPHAPNGQEEGVPMLFIHGAWHGAWCWEPILPYFQNRGYAAYALSLRGHGLSTGHHDLRFTSLNDYVDDIHRVASQFQQPPILVGHSMGGHLVRMYMQRYDVAAAVLLAPASPQGVWQATWRLARRHFWPWLKSHATLSLYSLVAHPMQARALLFGDMDLELTQDYWGQLGDESYRAFLEMLKPLAGGPKNPETPLLVIGGDEDAIFSVADFEALAKESGAALRVLQGFAHDLMLQTGWEQMTRLVIDWLWEQGLATMRPLSHLRGHQRALISSDNEALEQVL